MTSSHHAIAWGNGDPTRYIGRLTLLPEHLELDGTTTTPDRKHGRADIRRDEVRSAVIVRSGELPAVRLSTAHGDYSIEFLTGGRGAALALVNELS